MEVDNHNAQPLSLLRAVAKPNQLDPTNRQGRPETAARPRATDLAARIRATPAAVAQNTTPVSLAAVDPNALSIGTGNGNGTTPNQPLTVDGLLEEWGEKGSRYDIDRDGTVNMGDLLKLLAKLSGAHGGPPPADDAKVVPPLGDLAAGHGELGDIAPVEDDGLPTPMTVEELMEQWGEKGSRYDLDRDGVVNMPDLLQLLARLANPSPATPEGKTPPDTGLAGTSNLASPSVGDVTPPGEAPEPMSVAGLLEAWGDKGSMYDLDQDGQVNMTDLLQLLARLGQTEGSGPPADPGITVTADATLPTPPPTITPTGDPVSDSIITPAPPPPTEVPTISADAAVDPESEPAQMTVKGLMDAWGQRGSMYDLDTNGVVNMNDLLQLLSQLSPNQPETGDAVATAQDLTSHPGREAAMARKLGRLADSLVSRLEQNGFGDRPPTNIHGIVSSLQLPEDQEKGLMERLANRYRGGLGVNFRG